MHAFVIERFKSPGAVAESPVPEPGANEIRVRVAAAGVNPIDWKLRSGMNPALPLPRILGFDFAGIVDAAGSAAAERLPVGTRVLGCARSHGTYAEFATLPLDAKDEPVSIIPEGIDDALAAALPTPGLTALACVNAAHIGAGNVVVIAGAAGAVGAIATQLATLRGARVIAAVRPKDFEAVLALGAERAIDSNAIAAGVAAAAGDYPEGITALLDLISDRDTLKGFTAFLKPNAAVVSTIRSADEAWFGERGFTALNVTMNQTPESSPAALDEITALVAAGTLRVARPAERPLAEAAEVLDAGEHNTLAGKVVLRP